MRASLAALLALSLCACKGGRSSGGMGIGQPCTATTDCADPLECVAGACALPGDLQACAPNALSCSGNDVVQCDAAGLKQTVVQTCDRGCQSGACIVDACTSGARQCGTAGVEQCEAGPSGALAWVLVQACAAGCDPVAIACNSLLCKPLDSRCAPDLQVCASDGTKWVDQPCAQGSTCSAGQCVAQQCTPNATFCDGSVLDTCNASGSGVGSQKQCPAGCANGACIAQACTPGATQCSADGTQLQSCKPDGSGWSVTQTCACVSQGAGLASCASQACAPLSLRCAAGGVEICAGDGSGWGAPSACDNGCANGACLPPAQGCTAGALRCDGAQAQRCDGTSWIEVAECLNGCSAGACLGASCAPGFTLTVVAPQPAPADGVSTLLVESSAMTDANGAALPDGTLVSLAPAASIVAPSKQVAIRAGTIAFEVRAPSTAGALTIAATVAGSQSCAAATTLQFNAPAGFSYVSEDFSTDTERDFQSTSAQWSGGRAFATSSDLGDGRDGAFTVPAGSFDLTSAVPATRATPLAAVALVTFVNAQSVTAQGTLAAFAPGDEALLIELQGAGPLATVAAGAWEFLNVASVSGNTVSFTTPVLGTYGEAPGAPHANEKIVLQRVPHFTDLNVPAGSTLTSAAWNGASGGVVAFRASGTVTVGGAISADGLGYRAGDSTDAVHDQPGESYGGLAAASQSPAAFLGAGGGGYLCGDPFHLSQLDTWYGSGGSYGTAGGSTCTGAGATYGSPSLSRLFFGSGSGSQEQNTHGACSDSTCPSESKNSYSAGSQATGVGCTTQACTDTFKYCGAEAKSFASAIKSGSCGTQACTDTFNNCSAYTVSYQPAQKLTNGSCGTQACTDTFNVCSAYTGVYNVASKSATAGCTGQACTNTFAACTNFTQTFGSANNPQNAAFAATYANCGAYNVGHQDSPYPSANDCANACPALVKTNQTSCFSCGCTDYGKFDCRSDECAAPPGGIACLGECSGSDWGGTGNNTGFFGACNNPGQTCTQESDCGGGQFCVNNCNFIGTDCDCHWMGRWCYHTNGAAGGQCDDNRFCRSCNTCTGCTTNPGCSTNPGCNANPGCSTNPGCQTDTGCSTCGGRLANDGAVCDYTDPNNKCRCPLAWQAHAAGGRGGGIVLAAMGALNVVSGGRVSALGLSAASGNFGGAGGSVFLKTGALSLVSGASISAAGGVGGGAGRVRIDSAGGTDPVASGLVTPAPYTAPFALPQAQSKALPLPSGESAISVQLVANLDTPGVSYFISTNGGAAWQAIAPGQTLTFAPTADLRWRARLLPIGATAAVSGLSFLVGVQ